MNRLGAIAAALAGLLLMQAGPVAAQSAPSSYTTGFRYDLAGRKTGTISPDPDGAGPLHYAAVRSTYDSAGRLIKAESGELAAWQSEVVAPASWAGFTVLTTTTTDFDALDRKTVERALTGATVTTLTQYSYDLVGRLDCTAVRMNPAVYASLPASACTLGAQGSVGPDRITKNIYDAAGQLLKVQKAYGTALQQDYVTYSYTLNGKQASVIDANGNKAAYSYDGFDRLTQWSFPSLTTPGSASTTDYEAYTYDANGNRLTQRRRDGRTLTFAYDALNRVTSKVVPDGCAPIQVGACTPAAATRDVYYAYDLQAHQLSAKFDSASGADGITNAYDGFGQLTSSTISMAGFAKTLSGQYDPDGNRTRLTHPDGVYFTYGYDGLDRMNYASWTTGSGTTPFMAITYDTAGRRADINRASSFTGYGYDAISRLALMNQRFAGGTGNANLTFGYNPASQMVSESRDNDAYAFNGLINVNRNYAVNGLNQYTTGGPASFTYDANGNLVSDGTSTYGYDAENRLVSKSNGAQLVYDPLGRLWQTSGVVWGNTRFLYDGDQLAVEYDGDTGSIRNRYMFAGQDEPILADAGGLLNCSGTKFLHTNHQGSIVALADCYGNRTAVNAYDEYGIPGSANQGRFQYTGQAWINELGMYYYKARIYSPTLGRFLQTDPIGYNDQINLYGYVANDPVDGRDPSGEEGEDIVVTAKRIAHDVGVVLNTPLTGHVSLPAPVLRAASAVGISQGCAESLDIRDCSAGEKATGFGIASLLIGLPELIASDALTGTLGMVPRAVSSAERKGLNELFQSGPKGADAFLSAAKSGQITKLPSGVTRGTLRVYIARVGARGVQGKGSQVARLEGIRILLSRNVR